MTSGRATSATISNSGPSSVERCSQCWRPNGAAASPTPRRRRATTTTVENFQHDQCGTDDSRGPRPEAVFRVGRGAGDATAGGPPTGWAAAHRPTPTNRGAQDAHPAVGLLLRDPNLEAGVERPGRRCRRVRLSPGLGSLGNDNVSRLPVTLDLLGCGVRRQSIPAGTIDPGRPAVLTLDLRPAVGPLVQHLDGQTGGEGLLLEGVWKGRVRLGPGGQTAPWCPMRRSEADRRLRRLASSHEPPLLGSSPVSTRRCSMTTSWNRPFFANTTGRWGRCAVGVSKVRRRAGAGSATAPRPEHSGASNAPITQTPPQANWLASRITTRGRSRPFDPWPGSACRRECCAEQQAKAWGPCNWAVVASGTSPGCPWASGSLRARERVAGAWREGRCTPQLDVR